MIKKQNINIVNHEIKNLSLIFHENKQGDTFELLHKL